MKNILSWMAVLSLIVAMLLVSACSAEDTSLSSETEKDSSNSATKDVSTEGAAPTSMASISRSIELGDIITFGAYEQDNDTSNGKEAIEWIVVSKNENSALLISRYVLDNQPYHSVDESITWQFCSLRKWLNETFFDEAFNAEEKSIIEVTTVKNNTGKSTKDRVSLLNEEEVERIFFSYEASRCCPTDYAMTQGVMYRSDRYTKEGKPTCEWQLRSSIGDTWHSASYVCVDGTFDTENVTSDNGIRPFIWIDVTKAEALGVQPQTATTTEAPSSGCNVGDFVTFGTYEQDNVTTNGQEPIEWQVLATEGNKALLISRYALDCQPFSTKTYYNEDYGHDFLAKVTWETCDLREWLNDAFVNNAFSISEQNAIQTTLVLADPDAAFQSKGNNTNDKVFLLSLIEINQYFASEEARICLPTEYAKAQGAYCFVPRNTQFRSDDEEFLPGDWATDWWLRSMDSLGAGSGESPGDNGAYYIGAFGNDDLEDFTWSLLDDSHSSVSVGTGAVEDLRSVALAVRPAIWVDVRSMGTASVGNGSGFNEKKDAVRTGITTDALKIRTGPSTSFDQVGYFKKGSQVTILSEEKNGWYKIKYSWSKDGQSGDTAYVSADYVSLN